MELPTPKEIKTKYPLKNSHLIYEARQTAKKILQREDKRLALIVGPCSIHNVESAIEYALALKELTPKIESTFFPIMRVFIEKPRTKLGWKGMLYDPHLDGSNDIATGISRSRELILKIADMGVPCATEYLSPLQSPTLRI